MLLRMCVRRGASWLDRCEATVTFPADWIAKEREAVNA